jgi:hypothetical protein
VKCIGVLCCLWTLAAIGCVLPSYGKSDIEPADAAESMTSKLPATNNGLNGASVECNSCVQSQCAQALTACGADCQNQKIPVTPADPAPAKSNSDAFDTFLTCLRDECEPSCKVTWGCVNDYSWPAASAPYGVTIRVIDLTSSSPLPNVDVTACLGSDPSCSAASTHVAQGTTDDTAHTTLPVPAGFMGYFLLAGDDKYMASSTLWTQPTYTVVHNFSQRMVPWDVAAGLAQATGTTLRHEAGHLIFRAHNCLPLRYLDGKVLNAEADDVVVTFSPSVDDSSKVFYTGFQSGIDPSLSGTSAMGGGFGGAFNLPTQLVNVVAKHDGMVVSQVAAQMRSGTAAFVYLMPSTR